MCASCRQGLSRAQRPPAAWPAATRRRLRATTQPARPRASPRARPANSARTSRGTTTPSTTGAQQAQGRRRRRSLSLADAPTSVPVPPPQEGGPVREGGQPGRAAGGVVVRHAVPQVPGRVVARGGGACRRLCPRRHRPAPVTSSRPAAEKYLREVWPSVTAALKELGVACELNLARSPSCPSTTSLAAVLLPVSLSSHTPVHPRWRAR